MNRHKNRHKYRTLRIGAGPTKERRRHFGGFIRETIEWNEEGRAVIGRYRARWTCPIDAYRHYGFISDREHQAGVIFTQAYHQAVAGIMARKERLNLRPANDRLSLSERVVRDAYRSLSPDEKKVIVDICGHEQEAQSQRQLFHLKKGLGELALLWSIVASEVTRRKP